MYDEQDLLVLGDGYDVDDGDSASDNDDAEYGGEL